MKTDDKMSAPEQKKKAGTAAKPKVDDLNDEKVEKQCIQLMSCWTL